MRKLIYCVFLILTSFTATVHPVFAQDSSTLPVYVVQSGDTLYLIGLKFNVSVDDLIAANEISNPNILSAGMEIKIPGLEGIQGKLMTKTIPLGQNITSLARFYQILPTALIRMNRLTSPAEVYAGANLILPESAQAKVKALSTLPTGQSPLEFALIHNVNQFAIAADNLASLPDHLLPGEKIFVKTELDQAVLDTPLEPYVSGLTLAPLPLVQGSTAVVTFQAASEMTIEGTLNGKELRFQQLPDHTVAAIQGIHAMSEPGLADFSLKVTLPDGKTETINQTVLLQDGFYAKDPSLSVDPETIDPANTKPEDTLVAGKTAPITESKMWDGKFKLPVNQPSCIKSWYGNRRSYNGGPFNFFHTGLDFGVCADLNILAPATGVVVFAGPLTVRGNATIIDHGWGIYTGYWHQQEILVHEGERVEPGQVIGLIGGTGRVTGPHLHFEVWANGVQVNPQEWLDRVIP